tara:strand:+ start:357 stop:530 length:174 start_codon:yes stop_codon:yes gene_type:complete
MYRLTDGSESGASGKWKQQLSAQFTSVKTSCNGMKANAEAMCFVLLLVEVARTSSLK